MSTSQRHIPSWLKEYYAEKESNINTNNITITIINQNTSNTKSENDH